MNTKLGIIALVLTLVLVAAGTIRTGDQVAPTTPEGAVQALYAKVQSRDLIHAGGIVNTSVLARVKTREYGSAYSYVANPNEVSQEDFLASLIGGYGSLRTNSTLQKVDTRVISQNANEALVRADLQWSMAVGAVMERRDLKVAHEGDTWKVVWPVEKRPNVPPQVIPVTYLRWDVIQRGSNDDWGAQNVEAPHVRIISMNAVPNQGGTSVLGEVVNEDTVPAFVSVNASLLAKDGSPLGEESSFDKISHTLLPKEVSPFRIDIPNVPLEKIGKVKIEPKAMLVGASADPVIGVMHQRLETTADGHHVLKGELVSESGQVVNIPHVLATYYDNSAKVIWVSDGYVSSALLPQSPVPFTLDLRDDLAAKVNNYRVTVNSYTVNRQGQ